MATSFDEQGIREAIAFYAEGMRTGEPDGVHRMERVSAVMRHHF